jgi:4-amino-4-deoxy-L-arabinose transferase-like glycosyltransferase
LVVVALALRLGLIALEPQPFDSSGLASWHGEMARNALSHGEWFAIDRQALELVSERQEQLDQLVDPAELDYTRLGEPEPEPQVLQPVGAAAVLTVLWEVSGDRDYIYLQLLQALVDALMVLLVFWISLRLFERPRAALLAAAGYALFLPVAVLAKIPHLDIWAVDAGLVIFALMLATLGAVRPLPWAAAAGLAAGAGAYFRPNLLLLPALVALAAVPWGSWRRSLAAGGVALLVAAVCLVPWTLRNFDEYDRVIPTRIGIGQNLWEGLGEVDNDFGAILDDRATERQVSRERPGLRYGTPEYDDHLREKAVDAIADHPDHFAKVIARRAAVSTIALHNLAWPWGGVEPLLLLAALATVVWTRRRFARSHLLLGGLVAATILPYLLLHVEPRYLLAASVAYLIWAALGLDLLADRLRSEAG